MLYAEGSKRPPQTLDAEALWSFALKLLGVRALSTSELREKLKRRAARPEDIENTLTRLREYKYIDDARYAENYAETRRDNQGHGKLRVLRDLRVHRVAPAIAEKAVAHAFEGTDEAALIEQYLARKFRNVNLPDYLKERKHLAAAFRRLQYAGFSTAASIRVLRRYTVEADQLEPEEPSV